MGRREGKRSPYGPLLRGVGPTKGPRERNMTELFELILVIMSPIHGPYTQGKGREYSRAYRVGPAWGGEFS